ncbi:MAG: DUF7674 family protein [Planctomycetota bacterium]|jgi:hypothetical protein
MNRKAAVQYLHDRHPKVIEPPGAEVDLQTLHLECCWFQGHCCELIDSCAEVDLRRCFETACHLLTRGDNDVRDAVCHHFVVPDLIFHPSLAWAKERMPPLLAELCDETRKIIDEEFAAGPYGNLGD